MSSKQKTTKSETTKAAKVPVKSATAAKKKQPQVKKNVSDTKKSLKSGSQSNCYTELMHTFL